MRSGLLRKRVTIQQDTPTRDSHGGEVSSWSEFAVRWASIEPVIGREAFTAQREHAEVTHRIRMRWDTTVDIITPKMRILVGSRIFDIQFVINNFERNRELHLLCIEEI